MRLPLSQSWPSNVREEQKIAVTLSAELLSTHQLPHPHSVYKNELSLLPSEGKYFYM